MSEQQDIATKDFFARVRALGLEKGTIVGIVDRLEAVIKQRDELLAALERAETAIEICSDWMTEIEMPDGWTTVTDEKLRISAAIISVKGGAE